VSPTVTITGGSGFVGQLLRRGLAEEGYQLRVFDQYRGQLVDLLRRRRLINATSPAALRVARGVRRGQVRAETWLKRAQVIRRQPDDILGDRDQLAARFAGSHAVIHLAGIPHPSWPGDFVRVNYDASVNVFEAARAAGVPIFVFASSAQVYRINALVRVDQFPILESNHLPIPAEGQTTYGFLKAAFERYLDGACTAGPTQAVALRLECPGFRSASPGNLYVSTSIRNLVAAFSCALRLPDGIGFDAFNIADAEVDRAIVDIQAYLRMRWPYVPNYTVGNQSLMAIEKAQRVLGYRPQRDGRYIDPSLVW
jgi:nucleoside-diphosphate-sugar epimerase